jgi:hypothetical protein
VNPGNVEGQIPDLVQQPQAVVNEQPAEAFEEDLIHNQMVVDEQPPNPDLQALDQGEDIEQISQSVQVGSSFFSSSGNLGTLLPDLNLATPEEVEDFPEVLLPANPVQPDLQLQDFLEPEIQPDELMNEEEIAAQIAEEQNLLVNVMPQRPATNFHLNLNVGLVRLLDRPIMDPLLPFCFQSKPQPNKLNADVYRLWAKNFSPVGKPELVVQIPKSWASFFLMMLLDPKCFDWAKGFLISTTWKILVNSSPSDDFMDFALPSSCPSGTVIDCNAYKTPSALNPPDPASIQDLPPSFVETTFRRSPRLKSPFGGFKQDHCSSRNCLACAAHPPSLSTDLIRSIAGSICKVPDEKLTDKALKRKPKAFKAIGEKQSEKKSKKKKKSKQETGTHESHNAKDGSDKED